LKAKKKEAEMKAIEDEEYQELLRMKEQLLHKESSKKNKLAEKLPENKSCMFDTYDEEVEYRLTRIMEPANAVNANPEVHTFTDRCCGMIIKCCTNIYVVVDVDILYHRLN
jgi:hypothetical protein